MGTLPSPTIRKHAKSGVLMRNSATAPPPPLPSAGNRYYAKKVANQMLFYCQAVDVTGQLGSQRKADLDVYDRMLAVPSVTHTKRLPGWVMLHPQMRVRLTTQVLPPWAVQDTTGTVMEIDLSARDRTRMKSSKDSHIAAEMVLEELPHGVYVKSEACDGWLLQ